MAGLNLIHQYIGDACRLKSPAAAAAKGLGPGGGEYHAFLTGADQILSCQGYPGYPTAYWEDESFHFYLEGHLYGQTLEQEKSTLTKLAAIIFAGSLDIPNQEVIKKLSDWVKETDGDYLIWIRDKKTGQAAVLNDLLARLPTYYQNKPDGLRLSRDVRFLRQLAAASIDRFGLALQLLLGHGLAGRTLWEDIHRLPPAGLLLIDPREKRTRLINLFTCNFSEKRYQALRPAENAQHLVEVFRQVCGVRGGLAQADVVSLSGGLDSRSVASGLAAAGRPFTAMTFRRSGYQPRIEAETAETIAAILGQPWGLVELPPAVAGLAWELLHVKNGLNTLALSFILNFYRAVKEQVHPQVTFFTGDGGDFILPNLRPSRPMTSWSGLIKVICDSNFYENGCLRIEDVVALTGVPRRDLEEAIGEAVRAYPERTWPERFLHYKIYGRVVQVINEAQDRERSYFWTAAPFLAPAFFDLAMNCPDHQKSRYRLYQRFITGLCPLAAAVPYSPTGYQLDSLTFRLDYQLTRLKKAWPRITKKIRYMTKGEDCFPPQAGVRHMIRRQIEAGPAVTAYLDRKHLDYILSPEANYSRAHLTQLFTAISAIEETASGRSSLEDEPDLVLF